MNASTGYNKTKSLTILKKYQFVKEEMKGVRGGERKERKKQDYRTMTANCNVQSLTDLGKERDGHT